MTKTVEEVKEWINTEEYKELNFKREAVVINPPKACQPLGAIFAASGFEKTLPYVHGSQGCTAYFRSNLSRHYREPFSTVSDSMTEDAAVFGGLNNIIEGLRNAHVLYQPSLIAMSTSCMAEVIGDDLNAFIGQAREKGSIPEDLPIPFAHTPSFVGSHITGYDSMLKAILENLHKRQKKTTSVKGSERTSLINIIPGFDPHVANIREIQYMLGIMGIKNLILADNSDVLDSPLTGEYAMYTGGTPLEDAIDASKNHGTIALQKNSTMNTIKYIQEEWENHPAFNMYPPMGIKLTDDFVEKISDLAGISVSKELEKYRGRAVDAATDAHQYIHGKRFAVFGDPDEVYGIVSFLLEMGGEPIHVLTATGSKTFKREMELLLASSPHGQGAKLYAGFDLWHMRSLLMTDPVDMMIGDSHGKWAARDANIPLIRIGYPIVDRVNMHRYPVIGYQGAINMITWIVNAFLEELDRNSDDAHFELLR
ncbi:MAG: nitrogenase molybdenum-iron protein subunit beta [Spirochaetia bacterium]|nr:nitrogenase molybdenum-iron protein subunit beta [Spirochaetia bacterium]